MKHLWSVIDFSWSTQTTVINSSYINCTWLSTRFLLDTANTQQKGFTETVPVHIKGAVTASYSQSDSWWLPEEDDDHSQSNKLNGPVCWVDWCLKYRGVFINDRLDWRDCVQDMDEQTTFWGSGPLMFAVRCWSSSTSLLLQVLSSLWQCAVQGAA